MIFLNNSRCYILRNSCISGASQGGNLLPSADCCVVRKLKNKFLVFFLLTIDYTTLLRPFGEKIRLLANFFLTSPDGMIYAV